jgi:hypothetical protein
MLGSRNAGVPLLTHAPRSKVQQSFAELAQALSGKNGHPSVDAQKKRTGFFSFK